MRVASLMERERERGCKLTSGGGHCRMKNIQPRPARYHQVLAGFRSDDFPVIPIFGGWTTDQWMGFGESLETMKFTMNHRFFFTPDCWTPTEIGETKTITISVRRHLFPILVGGLEHFYTFLIFPYIGNFIIPTDELHHFSEEAQPPTTMAVRCI